MIQLAGLLFSSGGSGELSFDGKRDMGKNVKTSDYSFEAALQKYQADLSSSPEKVVQGKYDRKHEEKDIKFVNSDIRRNAQEDKEEDISAMNISDGALQEFVQWLTVFYSDQIESSNITGNDFFESLKIIAPSIQHAIAQKPGLFMGDMNELRPLFDSLFLMDLEMDIGDELRLLNNIQAVLRSLVPKDAEININQELGSAEKIGNILSDIVENITLEKDLSNNSLEKWMSEYAKTDPKQIMSSMQLTGLGKKALISFAGDQENLEELATALEYEFDPLTKVHDEIKAVQSFDESQLLDYNTQDEALLKTKTPDLALIEPMNISSSANEIFDITNILEGNNQSGSIEIIRELAEKISMNLNNNRYEIELQLKPEQLGRLILKVTLEDGVLAGRIFTSSQQTADILQSNLDSLRNTLEELGYSFSQLDVNVGNEGNPEQFQYPGSEQINIRNRITAIKPPDETDELNGRSSNPAKNYIGLSQIDYFA